MTGAFRFDRRRALRRLAATLGVGAAAMAVRPGDTMGQQATRLMLFGDSLMAGYGLGAEEGFAARLSSRLAQTGYQVSIVKASISGNTSGDGARRLGEALSQAPDLVLLGFGGNDMLQGLPPSQLKQNLRTILNGLRDRQTPVLLLGMLASPRLGEPYARDFNAVYPDLADEFDIPLYPFFLEGVALDAALNQGDRIHPNARGVEVIVDRILPAVQALIDAT